MTRKSIPDATQNNVLLKSRRRCCLCFWLSGKDEVVKGQIAHLDQNNETASEDNLVFLCHDHHDEYDGKTSTSKGLKEGEVKKWRDELYREMEYRFRSVASRDLSLRLKKLILVGLSKRFKLEFRLTNTGDEEVSRPTVSIELPDKIFGKVPKRPQAISSPFGGSIAIEDFGVDLFGMTESESDIFSPGGRVGIVSPLPPADPILLAGHSIDFHGLNIGLDEFPFGTTLELNYRLDAEKMRPKPGVLTVNIEPNAPWEFDEIYEDDFADMKDSHPMVPIVRQIVESGRKRID